MFSLRVDLSCPAAAAAAEQAKKWGCCCSLLVVAVLLGCCLTICHIFAQLTTDASQAIPSTNQASYLVLCTLIVQFFKLMMMMLPLLLLMRPEMRMRILKMTIIVDSWTDARPCSKERWAFYLYSDGWTNMLYLGMSVCIHRDSSEKTQDMTTTTTKNAHDKMRLCQIDAGTALNTTNHPPQ